MHVTTGPPNTCIPSSCHCDTVAVEPCGICQPIFFKSILSMIAFLQMFLAKLGHYLEYPSLGVYLLPLRLRTTCSPGNSDPLTLHVQCATLRSFELGVCCRLWLASCWLCRVSYSCSDCSAVWGAAARTLCSHPVCLLCLRRALKSSLFFFLLKFTF